MMVVVLAVGSKTLLPGASWEEPAKYWMQMRTISQQRRDIHKRGDRDFINPRYIRHMNPEHSIPMILVYLESGDGS